MNGTTILHIANKEIVSTLRDRRAIVSNLLIPLLVLPVVMLGMPLVLGGLFEREGAAQTPLAASGVEYLPVDFAALLEAQNAELVEVADPLAAVENDEFSAGLSVGPHFAEALTAGERGALTLYSKRGNMRSELNAGKVKTAIALYQQQLASERLAAAGLDAVVLEPIAVTDVDASTDAERAGGMMAWMIPFFLAIWVLSGGQMIAIDATAGEKERGTLEVLLVAPVKRIEVVAGKVLATLATGLAAGMMAIAGYLLGGVLMRSFVATDSETAEFSQMMLGTMSIDAVTMVMLAASALLLSVLMANMLMGITMFAKTFKEAQSYVAPLGFLIIVPVLALQFADFFAFDAWVYLVPIVNVLLVMDGAVRGSLDASFVALAWGSTALYALLLLGFAYRSFQREDVLFRS